MENFYYDVYDWFNTDTAIVTIYWYGYNYYILIQLEWLYNDMAEMKQFSNTKSIVKVETDIVTLISYHHYLKIVGYNKLWPHM
jgi:hypothetical protein